MKLDFAPLENWLEKHERLGLVISVSNGIVFGVILAVTLGFFIPGSSGSPF